MSGGQDWASTQIDSSESESTYRGARRRKRLSAVEELSLLRKENVRLSNELAKVKQVTRAMLDAIEDKATRENYVTTYDWLRRKPRS